MVTEAIPGLIPDVDVAGKSLPGTLVSARVERALGLVGRAVLRYAPVPASWQPTGAPVAFGDPVTVRTPSNTPGEQSLFAGFVTGLQLEQHHGRRELVVTADDAASRLTLGTQTTTYLGQSYNAVLDDIAKRADLTLTTSAPAHTADESTYYLHSGTDLEFLDHVAARTGRVWWVEPGGNLRWEATDVSDGTVELRIDDGDTFSVRATGLKPEAVDVVGWDPAQQKAIQGSATTSRATQPTVAAGYPAQAEGMRRLVVRDAAPLSPAEASALAGSVAAEAAAEAVSARGETAFVPGLAPAVSVKVSGTGVMDGTFRLSEVDYLYTAGVGLRVRFTAGPIRPSGLVDLLGAGRPRHGGGHILEGVVAGIVSNLNDTQNQGRVRVNFPVQGDQIESAWARILTPGGGAGRGLEFQPEVGDEVLLAFELGDVRRPVVLGGLYSDVNGLPTSPAQGNVASGQVTYRRLTTRVGHVVELADGDKPETQHVRIELGSKRHRIRLGEDKTEITIDRKPVTITNGGATITFSDSGDVTIEGNNITLKAKRDVKVEGMGVGVKSTAETKVEGNMVTVKASAGGQVDGGSQLALKGGMVMVN